MSRNDGVKWRTSLLQLDGEEGISIRRLWSIGLSMSKIGDLEVGHGDGAPAREMKHDKSRGYVMRR